MGLVSFGPPLGPNATRYEMLADLERIRRAVKFQALIHACIVVACLVGGAALVAVWALK